MEPLLEEDHGLGDLLREVRALGTRAHQAHLASKHVDELREFVDPELAEDPADARDPRIVVAGPDRAGELLGVRSHRPELDEHEGLRSQAQPLLLEEHRPPGVHLDEQRHQGKHQDRDRCQEQRRHDHVGEPLHAPDVHLRAVHGGAEEPLVIDILERDLPRQLLVQRHEIDHGHAPVPERPEPPEQGWLLLQRAGEDQSVDGVRGDELLERVEIAKDRKLVIDDPGALAASRIDAPQDLESRIVMSGDEPQHALRLLGGADDEAPRSHEPAPCGFGVHGPDEQDGGEQDEGEQDRDPAADVKRPRHVGERATEQHADGDRHRRREDPCVESVQPPALVETADVEGDREQKPGTEKAGDAIAEKRCSLLAPKGQRHGQHQCAPDAQHVRGREDRLPLRQVRGARRDHAPHLDVTSVSRLTCHPLA